MSDFHSVETAKMSVNSNFILISMFFNELSSDLLYEVKIISLFIFLAQNQFSSLFVTKKKLQLKLLLLFSQTPVKNRVTKLCVIG